MKAREYSEQRILAIPADVNEDGQVFYLNEDLGTADDEHNGLAGEIEMAFNNGYGAAMLEFKEYLEKKKSDIYWNEPSLIDRNMKLDLLKEIINELFKVNRQ